MESSRYHWIKLGIRKQVSCSLKNSTTTTVIPPISSFSLNHDSAEDEQQVQQPSPPPIIPSGVITHYSARTGHSIVEFEGNIYLFGGTDRSRRLADLWVFRNALNLEPGLGKWELITPEPGMEKPSPRSGATSIVHNRKLYIWAGHDSRHAEYFNDLWAYSFDENIWTHIKAKGDLPVARTDHSFVKVGEKFIVFGGFDGTRRWNDLHSFDLETFEWKKIEPSTEVLPSARFGHSACVDSSRGVMWVFGGWDGKNTHDDLWSFSFHTLTWTKFEPSAAAADAAITTNSPQERMKFPSMRGCSPSTSPMLTFYASTKTPVPPTVSASSSASFFGKDSEAPQSQSSSGLPSSPISPSRRIPTPPLNALSPARRLGRALEFLKPSEGSAIQNWPGQSTKSPGNDCESNSRHARRHSFGSCISSETVSYGACATPIHAMSNNNSTSKKARIYDDVKIPPFNHRPPPPHNRYRHTAVVYNDAMYIFGGVDKTQTRYNDLHRFDFNTQVWEMIQCTGAIPSGRTFHVATVINDSLIITGGYDGSQRLNDAYAIYLGIEKPKTLSEICSNYIRENFLAIAESDPDGIEQLPNFLIESHIFGMSQYDSTLRGRIVDSTNRIVVCHGYRQSSCYTSLDHCTRCGEPVDSHEMLKPEVLKILLKNRDDDDSCLWGKSSKALDLLSSFSSKLGNESFEDLNEPEESPSTESPRSILFPKRFSPGVWARKFVDKFTSSSSSS